MANMSVQPIGLNPNRMVGASQETRKQMLRQAIDETVGVTFFGQMMKIARENPFKADFAHGGRGEEIFGGQLDMELARRVGRGVNTGLSEAIYKRFEKRV